MRSYVILSNWTDQGIKNSRDTIKRAKHFHWSFWPSPPFTVAMSVRSWLRAPQG